jgi:hypothetical protein
MHECEELLRITLQDESEEFREFVASWGQVEQIKVYYAFLGQ